MGIIKIEMPIKTETPSGPLIEIDSTDCRPEDLARAIGILLSTLVDVAKHEAKNTNDPIAFTTIVALWSQQKPDEIRIAKYER
jgi:hypothetical protein